MSGRHTHHDFTREATLYFVPYQFMAGGFRETPQSTGEQILPVP